MDQFYAQLRETLPEDAFARKSYGISATIFRAGETVSSLYFVDEGEVSLRRYLASGDILSIQNARARSFLAEASLFSEQYHCDAVALRESTLIAISHARLFDAMRANPELTLNFAAELAKSLRDHRQNLEIRQIKRADARVLAAMQIVPISGSVKDFASQIGLTHEACYRALRKLVNQGQIVQTARGRYVLKSQ